MATRVNSSKFRQIADTLQRTLSPAFDPFDRRYDASLRPVHGHALPFSAGATRMNNALTPGDDKTLFFQSRLPPDAPCLGKAHVTLPEMLFGRYWKAERAALHGELV